MSAKKRGQNARQRAMSTTGYAYAFLLILQTILIGVNAENRIQQGDSKIEVLMWMINQYIPVLKQASSFQKKQKKSLLPTHRHSEDK
ncbi:MAG: hypothetical protein RMZ41_008350 [Nostoc sp. DedVER02]|uniref:hypothetical protein n=1 Tax=unclassified Nostoc TaxID=2593658 RepID=UPI002AD49F3D|nr:MULTISPECIES: hypothetical protein [unclassified Nostoc]MDZ7990314.1 hypothetical protein [Nostoc sp. DedVER02]MDZ8115994.1 hypothetical protein [Nostoc sp. DedVER01b]